ncbi:MAG: hypothetical protein LBU83_05020 [Bacteroidales bacterium]|jgi:hypothetical protein|nr:hypothetical protein [Bacteroidales bacterium]
MKKYTNKILIIATAIFLVVSTIMFFVRVSEIKKELKEENIQLIINH